jgi:hypothetical protein
VYLKRGKEKKLNKSGNNELNFVKRKKELRNREDLLKLIV